MDWNKFINQKWIDTNLWIKNGLKQIYKSKMDWYKFMNQKWIETNSRFRKWLKQIYESEIDWFISAFHLYPVECEIPKL